MVPPSNFLAFALTAAVIVAIPGPSVVFTISRALTVGRRSALLTVAGNAAGIYLQVVAAAFGMAAGTARAWFARSPRRMATIGGTGGLVMIGLGTSLALTGRKN